MKKGLTGIFALILVLMLALAGCGPATQENTSQADADATPEVSETAEATETSETSESAEAPADSFTIGITQIVDHPSLNVCREGALAKLAELGYVEGENLIVKYENAQNDTAVATTIAQQFASEKVDLIIAIATPTAQAAYAVTQGTIPVVFSAVSEPVEAELAAADGSAIEGVTGTSDKLPVDKTFELIKALTPDAVKVGILHNTGEVNSDVQLAEAKEKSAEYGLEILDAGITSTNEIASALDALLPDVDVMMNLTDNMVVSSLPLLVQKCNEAKVPLYGSEDTQVTGGALASAGVDYEALGEITGEMAANILSGTPAKDIPIATLDQPKLIVNSDQLTLLGLTVPDEISGSVETVTTAAAEESEE